MTIKRYLAESSLTGTATVVEVGSDGRGAWVRLDQTWFHPQGGGQKADRGTIGGARIVHVAHAEEGAVNHYVEDAAGLQAGQTVPLEVDAEWRAANARWHTGGHLVAAAGESLFPTIVAVAGHHWPGEGRVEFDPTGELPADLEAAKDAFSRRLAELIGEELPVRVLGDPFTDRSVQIGEHRPLPCGGTHVPHTGHLKGLAPTSVRVKGGKLRVSYST